MSAIDRKQREGFTLIELLVVISIIALLIGILLPALAAARKTASGIKCMSNIRSAMMMNQLYAADHDGRMLIRRTTSANPTPGTWGGNSYSNLWWLSLAGYHGNVRSNDSDPQNEYWFTCTEAAISDIPRQMIRWRCFGSNYDTYVRGEVSQGRDVQTWIVGSNYPGFRGGYPTKQDTYVFLNTAAEPRLTEFVIAADTKVGSQPVGEATHDLYHDSTVTRTMLWASHGGGGVNLAYADGHASRTDAPQIERVFSDKVVIADEITDVMP